MATADEAAAGATTPLGAALRAGLDNISYQQTITFRLYVRLVMPIDGYVFWVRASLLQPTPQIEKLTQTLVVKGSMHNVAEERQGVDENYVNTRVIFTSQAPVTDFNLIGPEFLYIGTFDGGQFAFSSRSQWYQQADLWHYVGNAVNSVMQRQIIDDPAEIKLDRHIVSNSLPGWLALNTYQPIYTVPLPIPMFQLYPSFLSPLNLSVPFGTVHIEPSQTIAQQSVPYLDETYTHTQLAQDHVEIALWGCDNDLALAWMDNVIQYTLDIGPFGLINMPIMKDDKRTQVEVLAIAQKKSITFDVSYNQFSMRNITRQLILSAFMTVYATDIPVAGVPIFPPVT
jgi:hypothetical protein